MKIEVECEDSVVKEVSAKDINVGVPVYVPKKWFEARGGKDLTIQLLLLPKRDKPKFEEDKTPTDDDELKEKLIKNSVEV